ncbi:beta-1,4-galactosyltransferase 4 [Stegostoma tigrinum]|uniref:beta-1,4-galactosyltransferase 4 n=1 Tax=Stegostoma tigrinum TaxID=3053191 RepID=UPI00202B7807|nr:beta-1,4-galactosyltransferase 4 [Stegostoma tigrinum]XP_048397384.1 beta-1,4-galactosyltransferase 4 [Stegostoma tigrinum]XP_048397386.1 beta-1,4-galactosyltransferase 4 [Stegostoma tigrinum]XP_059506351.1 beta-1,4-galactosyltransferase 4 [Stegostoma tigrinum]XP_059506352.1 beta-1,4-galactosyltransferase 4 [Stegostoma tigrinum]
MACKLGTYNFPQRLKLLLIIVSLGSILTWIVTHNIQDLVWEVNPQPLAQKVQKLTGVWMTSAGPPRPQSVSPTPTSLPLCAFLSPYLRGATALKFDARLTFEQVQKSNPKVQEGRYRPQECHAVQRVAILIPYRNRERHLLYLLEHLHPFLQRQLLDYGIYVINQAGNGVFNRAKLLNVGFLEALKEHQWDCFIFHDVDLVPENDFNLYLCDHEPKHLVVGRNATGYRLRYKGYFGGATAMTKQQFTRVNGFSNRYWGWGGEDDDLRIRVQLQKMKIVRPALEVARYTMTFHTRDHGNEINPERMALLKKVPQVWSKDGLNSCSYKVLMIEHKPLYINITVDIGDPRHNPEVAV